MCILFIRNCFRVYFIVSFVLSIQFPYFLLIFISVNLWFRQYTCLLFYLVCIHLYLLNANTFFFGRILICFSASCCCCCCFLGHVIVFFFVLRFTKRGTKPKGQKQTQGMHQQRPRPANAEAKKQNMELVNTPSQLAIQSILKIFVKWKDNNTLIPSPSLSYFQNNPNPFIIFFIK